LTEEKVLLRRMHAKDGRTCVLMMPTDGVTEGRHVGVIPGAEDFPGAFVSVNPESQCWEILNGSETWEPLEDFEQNIRQAGAGWWIAPGGSDQAEGECWWATAVDVKRFFNLMWLDAVEPVPLQEPSRTALYRSELLGLPTIVVVNQLTD